MATQPEARLSKKVCEALQTNFQNCMAEKVHGDPFGRCILDIRGSIEGYAFEIEAKMPGNEPSDRQKKRISDLEKNKVITGWFTTVQGAIDIVYNGYMQKLKQEKERCQGIGSI
jgi:hypothetical protein